MKLLIRGLHKRFFSSLNSVLASSKPPSDYFSPDFSSFKEIENEFEVEEVKINLPSGHRIAGKWWGNKSVRPFLCLHGWQDNAGSFDRIIPLLPRNHSYLAIDLLGHGLSSRLPNGISYHSIDNICQILELRNEYGWEKISVISHSMSTVTGLILASVFPGLIDMYIGIEGLKPLISDPSKFPKALENNIKGFMLADERNRENTEPPSYTIEEMAEKMAIATRRNVTKECAPYLLRRNIKKSEKFVDKFYFNRDSRLKFSILGSNFRQAESLELAKKVNVPYMVIKATNGYYWEKKEYFYEVVDALKMNNKDFEFHYGEGGHHLHLIHPQNISGIMSEFINKHRKSTSS